MGIENETQRTSSKLDCKHNVLHKPILLKMEKEIIINAQKKRWMMRFLKEEFIGDRVKMREDQPGQRTDSK